MAIGGLVCLLLPSCSDEPASTSQCEIQPRLDALLTATDELATAAGEMKRQLAVACAALAGEPLADPSSVTDEALQAACSEARLAIQRQVDAGLTISFEPAVCLTDSEDQAACEATCQTDPTCEEVSLASRCEGETDTREGTLVCVGELAPPACAGDAACFGACESIAKSRAECLEPVVTATGGDDPGFIAMLEEHLPTVLSVTARAALAVDSSADIVVSIADLAADTSEATGCGLDEEELKDWASEAVAATASLSWLLPSVEALSQ